MAILSILLFNCKKSVNLKDNNKKKNINTKKPNFVSRAWFLKRFYFFEKPFVREFFTCAGREYLHRLKPNEKFSLSYSIPKINLDLVGHAMIAKNGLGVVIISDGKNSSKLIHGLIEIIFKIIEHKKFLKSTKDKDLFSAKINKILSEYQADSSIKNILKKLNIEINNKKIIEDDFSAILQPNETLYKLAMRSDDLSYTSKLLFKLNHDDENSKKYNKNRNKFA